jgi:hypothetical protein
VGDLGGEGSLLAFAERGNAGGFFGQKASMGSVVEYFFFDADRMAANAKGIALLGELRFFYGIETHLIKEAQQPWLPCFELGVFQKLVPDRQCPAD